MGIAARFLQAGQKYLTRLLIGLLLLAVYAAAGFRGVPQIIQARLLPEVSKLLDAELRAERVDFDPFAFELAIHGLSLNDKAGREVAALRELSADLALVKSLTQGRLVLDGRLTEPALHAELDTRGRLNLAALLPAGESGGGVPFLVERFKLERGRVEFRDSSRAQPYTAVFGGMALELENLGSEPDQKARFRLAAVGENRESFSAAGNLSISPFRSEGTLAAAGVNPGFWLERLAPDLPLRFHSGTLGAHADFLMGFEAKPQLEIRSGEVRAEGLNVAFRNEEELRLKIASAAAAGISCSLADGSIKLDSVVVQATDSPWGSIASLFGKDLSFAVPEQRITLAAGTIQEAAGGLGKLASLSFERASFDIGTQRLEVGLADAREAALPWLKIGSATAGALSYELRQQRLQLAHAEIKDALALGSLGPPDSPPAAPAGPHRGGDGSGKFDKAAANAERYRPRPARIGSLRISGIDGSLQDRSLAIDSVVSEQAEMDLRRLPGGVFRVRGLPPLPIAPQSRAPGKAPWNVEISALRLEGYSFGFRDETVHPPVRVNFGPAALRLSNFNTRHRNLFEFYLKTGAGESGTIEVDGQARLEPLQVDLRFGVDQFWLRALQPYWHHLAGFDLQRGKLNLWGDITVRRGSDLQVDYSGGADIVDLEALDRRKHEPLLRWNSLKFEGLVVHSNPKRFAVRTVTAEQPFGRVVVGADGRLNLAHDLVRLSRSPGQPAKATKNRWPVVIGLLRSKDGRMHFSDLTLKPGFVTEVHDLNGNVSGLSAQNDARANLLFEGRISGNSAAKIYGQINPFNFRDYTDVSVEFHGLNLTALSAYAGKFAGYRIEKGKLDMYLRYKLQDNELGVENRLVLDQLDLGERVDSSSATTLPVDLAIALLKDSEGRIDFDLPITGSLTNPQFSLLSLYANAFTQFFRKLVTSPFTLVGSLVQGGDESLAFVKFLPGQKVLADDEKAKLGKIARALKNRPGLALNIRGAADPDQDRRVLAEQALLRQLKTARKMELRAQGTRVRDAQALELSDEDYRRLFTQFYRQRHSDAPELQNLAESKQPALEGPPFQSARRKIVEEWGVNEMELRLLAQARAESIRSFLVEQASLPDKQIYLLDVRLDQPGEKDIRALLSLSGT